MIIPKMTLRRASRLLEEGLVDTSVLSDPKKAGFDPQSDAAGLRRQSFSAFLSIEQLAAIHRRVTELHCRLVDALRAQPNPLYPVPYDVLRLDAFFNPTSGRLDIIEINARSVGMHEVTEWLDHQVAKALGRPAPASLNFRIAEVQHRLSQYHSALSTTVFVTSHDPWLYEQALVQTFEPKLRVVRNLAEIILDDSACVYGGQPVGTLIKKGLLDASALDVARRLDTEGKLLVLQSPRLNIIGQRHFLKQLGQHFSPQTLPLSSVTVELIIDAKDSWVLKREGTSGSRGVVVGRSVTDKQWRMALQAATDEAALWVIQRYVQPSELPLVVHGRTVKHAPTQLSIFMTPSLNDHYAVEIDMFARAYGGRGRVRFDPAGVDQDIWFGNVIVVDSL